MQYRPEIDGLRALAVLPVIFFHAGFDLFSGGFVGVDVFFVISGYLITSIIIADQSAGRFSIASFYERRARRILPALFFVTLVTIPIAWLLLLPSDLVAFGRSVLAVVTFSSNFLFWKESGYFDAAVELKPLLHTWSLAVEEQFYIVFPIALLLLSRASREMRFAVLAMLALISLVLAQWTIGKDPAAGFYLLPTRAWELIIGALIALYTFEWGKAKSSELLSCLGLFLVLLAVLTFDDGTPFPDLYALVPVIGAGLVILFTPQSGMVSRILGSKALVGLGLVSYSAYLLHHPIFAFVRYRSAVEPSTYLMLVLTASSIILAYFTWRFVEAPFRNKVVVTSRTIVIGGLAAGVLVLVSGISVMNLGPQPQFASSLAAGTARIEQLVDRHTSYDMYEHMYDDQKCRFWDRSVTPQVQARFDECVDTNTDTDTNTNTDTNRKALIVFGDSHAMNLFNIIAKSDATQFVVGIAQGGCRASDEVYAHCRQHYDDFEAFLASRSGQIQAVIYHQAGSTLVEDDAGEWNNFREFEPAVRYGFSDQNVAKVFNYVNRLSVTVPTLWLGPWVEARVSTRGKIYGHGISRKSIRIFQELDDFIESRIDAQDDYQADYISLVDELAITEDLLWYGDCVLYRDNNHFSRCGEDVVADRHRSFWTSLVEEPG